MEAPKNLIIESHKVPLQKEPIRLQDYAVGIFKKINTRAGIKKAIKRGLVQINGEKGHTGDYIKGGEMITLIASETDKKPILDYPLEVLYEDNHLAIINKPAGVLVSGNKRFTIENALGNNLIESTEEDGLARPEPIHRLDYPTTGALLIGKTASSVILLNKMFENKQVSKMYYAVTTGQMEDQGIISEPIDEKSSKSEFKKVRSIPSEKYAQLNLLALIPHTGRRHQLRKHLFSIGHPIFGDSTYIKDGKKEGSGLYLHAFSLTFIHPITSKEMYVKAPFPKKFTRLFPDLEEVFSL